MPGKSRSGGAAGAGGGAARAAGLAHIAPGDRLVPIGAGAGAIAVTNLKAQTERPPTYPERAVEPGATWQSVGANYHPREFTAPVVTAHEIDKMPPGGNAREYWADPADPRVAMAQYHGGRYQSYEGAVRLDGQGRPINPMGPTGIDGRGELGRWGANYAADPIVTRVNGRGQLEMIVIQRRDSGEFALPGGMVDRGERSTATVARELGEEASAHLDFKGARQVYKGYVSDRRNTDNAWMETDAYHLHLPPGTRTRLKANDDATGASWKVVNRDLLGKLYASHGAFVQHAIADWQRQTGNVVSKSGRVGRAATSAPLVRTGAIRASVPRG